MDEYKFSVEVHKDSDGYASVRMADVLSGMRVAIDSCKGTSVDPRSLQGFYRLFETMAMEIQMNIDDHPELSGCSLGDDSDSDVVIDMGELYS